MPPRILLVGLLGLSACTGADTDTDADPVDTDPADTDIVIPPPGPNEIIPAHPNFVLPAPDVDGCHGLFAQDLLPTFELDISDEEWAGLVDEWANGPENEEREDRGEIDDYNPYHPVERFKYGEIEIFDAMVRLRGNPTWWPDQNKLQMQVSFNEYRKEGRFLGLRKLALDAATYNRAFLRDRLALSILRDAGLEAPCANNARVVINGEYYGLYTSIEKTDKEFLQARFADPDGDLWKRADWTLKTNEDESDDTRISAANDATTPEALEVYVDLAHVRTVAAAEAVIPDADGFWAGGLNFYVYDDPSSGRFVILPWDLDNSFERLTYETDPLVWHKEERFHGRPWYDLAVQGDGQAAYVEELARIRADAYDPDVLASRIRTWSAQIEDAAFEDPNKPFTNTRYLEAVDQLEDYVRARAAYVDGWITDAP